MGVALLYGSDLLDYRVKTFRNGRKVHDLLAQARSVMVELLEETNPDVVLIERPFFAKTKRSALLTFLVQELRGRIRSQGFAIREYGPREIRFILLGNPQATKRDIAAHVAQRFPELADHLHPQELWKEKYWSHVFDAVALALADLTVGGRERTRVR